MRRAVSAGTRSVSGRLRGWHVLDDKQHLARLDEAEVAPGEFLDGGRLFTQASGLFPQAHVIRPRSGQLGREFVMLAPCFHQGQHAAIPDHCIEAEDQGKEEQQKPEGTPPPSGGLGPFRRLVRRWC